jgi:hypothetical protein
VQGSAFIVIDFHFIDTIAILHAGAPPVWALSDESIKYSLLQIYNQEEDAWINYRLKNG